MTDRELDLLLLEHAPRVRDQWLSSLPGRDELPQVPTSPRFERRMARLLRRSQRPRRHSAALRWAGQAAVVVLVSLAVAFSGLMITSQAFRAQVLSVITQVFEEITEFHYSSSVPTDQQAGEFTLTYLPKGMEKVSQNGSNYVLHTFFEDPEGRSMRVTHMVIGDKTSNSYGLDTEDANITYFKIHEEDAMAVQKKGVCTIVWTHESSVYIVSGTISLKEAKLVALGLE